MTRAIIFLLPILFNLTFAQNAEEAEKLVGEGVAYHDKGDYEGAIVRYDKALKLDKDNALALAEKAMSLLYLQRYEESVSMCQKAIEVHPEHKVLGLVYVTYGNALDGLKKTDKSIEIYDEGLKYFPDYHQLHFNKGVTLASVQKYDEANRSFQNAAKINPKHASSHNAIARISLISNKKIPSLLAYCRFFVLEPQSKRAVENLANLKTLINGNVESTGKKSVTINLNPDMLGDTTVDGKPKENNFSSTDLILSMSAALDFSKKNKKRSEVEKFIDKIETVSASMKETKKDNFGFFWDYYAPYFIEMGDKDLVETFGYLVFATSDEKDVSKWLKKHQSEINEFYEWSNSYEWE